MIHEVKVIKTLRNEGWQMKTKHINKCFGTCNYFKEIITINPLMSLVTTIVHELIHAEKPQFNEETVRTLEKVRRRVLTRQTQEDILYHYNRELFRAVQPFI